MYWNYEEGYENGLLCYFLYYYAADSDDKNYVGKFSWGDQGRELAEEWKEFKNR